MSGIGMISCLGSISRIINNPLDENSNVNILNILDTIYENGKFELDDVLALKKINNHLVGFMDCSISRKLKDIVEDNTIKFNDSEIQALHSINNLLSSPYNKVMDHEFFVMGSLARLVSVNKDKKRTNRFSDVFHSYNTNNEVDIVLSNNGARIYYAYIRLFVVLCDSIYAGAQK